MEILFCLNQTYFYRYLYWVDSGQYPKIERARLDGSDRKTIVQNGVSYPRGITVDIWTNDVYWVDSVVDAIQVCLFSYFIFSVIW